MTMEAFEVIVGTHRQNGRDAAIADASAYLAYADRTDLFGRDGSIIDITVYEGEDTDQIAVGIQFAVPLPSDDDVKRLMDEFVRLSRVETVELVAYEEDTSL